MTRIPNITQQRHLMQTIQRNQSMLARTQLQIASGTRIQQPSDDRLGTARAMAAMSGIIASSGAQASRERRAKPEVGDTLVHAFGERAGMLIVPEDVGRELVFAFAKAADGTVRDGSLHNQVSVLRLDGDAMSDKTLGYAAGALVAVSAACTHTVQSTPALSRWGRRSSGPMNRASSGRNSRKW